MKDQQKLDTFGVRLSFSRSSFRPGRIFTQSTNSKQNLRSPLRKTHSIAYFTLVTRTSNSSVASVLNNCSNLRFPSLVVGRGSCPSFFAANTMVEGSSIRRSPPLRIPIIPSSKPGGASPRPTSKAYSLKSVSSLVEKYLTPPGSFAVAKDLHRIVISTATLDPAWTTVKDRGEKVGQSNEEAS